MAGTSGAGSAIVPKEDVASTEQAIYGLKKLFVETIDVDVALQRAIYIVEKSYESEYQEIFDKRFKLLEEYRKSNAGGDNSFIRNFWLTVIKASYTNTISEQDEKILTHLIDVRSIFYNNPEVKFVLQFTFEPNNYFENRTLAKTYYIKYIPEAENPFKFEGAEIVRCDGCQIEWKNKELVNAEKGQSFFEFFVPPILPEDPNDPNYATIETFLKNDYNFGFYLKDEVIPNAVILVVEAMKDASPKSDDVTGNANDDEANISQNVNKN